MSKELAELKFRSEIPKDHRQSLDTRLVWLWNQRIGTVQTILQKTTDLQDRTAAELVMRAIYGDELRAIDLLFKRLEGGTRNDQVLEDEEEALRL